MPTAAQVMDRSASLLNDTAKSVFTYANQIPYLNTALDELQEEMELNNVPVTNKTSAALTVPIGTVVIGPATIPAYPSDMIEIQKLSERLAGTTNDFIQMTKMEFLPLTEVQTSSLIYWSWENQTIRFIGATTDRQVKIEYVAAVITAVTTSTSSITVFNTMSYLAYRTAALCAHFIGENPERADQLNGFAALALTRFLGINTKGRQSITTRRRPFRASYKMRGWT